MSSYVRRIGVEVYGNVSGFLASLNQMNAGITRTASGLRAGSQEAGAFSGQLRAIGTTAKYALAGELVFGITGAISKLSQLQVALGNISTVATQPGGGQGLTGVSKFRQELIDLSNQTVTPVQNLTDAITALYSSLAKNLPQSDILNLTKEISMIARTSQVSNPQDLVGSLLGGATAFGMPQGAGAGGLSASVSKLGDQFKYVLQKSRNMTGEEYAQYSGNLYKRAGLAGLTSEQTGALAIQATMLGGPASTNMQNLSQMLLYLRNPKSAAAKAGYAQAGITHAMLTSNSPDAGWPILQKLFAHVQSLPPGQRSGFITGAFGRMQSQTTMQSIFQAGGMPAVQMQVKGLAGSIGDVKSSFDQFKKNAPLAYLGNTLSNLSTTIASDIPGLSGGARGLGGALQYIQSPSHDLLRKTIEGGVAGILASRTAAKFLPGLRGKGGIFGRALFGKGGGSKALGGAIMAEEANAVVGGAAADGSRTNPFWVIISPWSWSVGSPGGFGSPVGSGGGSSGGGGGIHLPGWIPVAGLSKLAAKASRYGGSAVDLFGAEAPALGDALSVLMGKDPFSSVPKGHPALAHYFKKSGNSSYENDIVTRFYKGNLSPDAAERRLAALSVVGNRASQVTKVEIAGEANGNFKVTLVDKNGNVIGTAQEKGVPVKLWNVKQFPSSGGKPGTKKGSGK